MGKSLFRITDMFICKEVMDVGTNAISESINDFVYKSGYNNPRPVSIDAQLNDVFEFSITLCGKNLYYNDDYGIYDSFGIDFQVVTSEGILITASEGYDIVDFGGSITFNAKEEIITNPRHASYLLTDNKVVTKTGAFAITQECWDAYLDQREWEDEIIVVYMTINNNISMRNTVKTQNTFTWLLDFYIKHNGAIISKYDIEDEGIAYPTPLLDTSSSGRQNQLISSRYASNPAARYS